MNFSDIEIFLDIYRTGSLKRVAESRRVAPSTISRELNRLEECLGVRLFERTTRKVLPTQEGTNLFQRSEPLMEEFAKLKEEIANQESQDLRGKLRITSPVSFGLTHLVPILKAFQKKHPQIQIESILDDNRIDVLSERIDFAFRFGKLEDSSLVAKKLQTLEYKVYASPNYLKNKPSVKRPQDLMNHNCINFLLPGLGDAWKFRKTPSSQVSEVQIQCKTHFSNAIAIREAVKSGMGIAILPSLLMGKEKLATLLDSYECTPTNFDSKLWLVYPSREFLPRRSSEFIQFIESYLSV